LPHLPAWRLPPPPGRPDRCCRSSRIRAAQIRCQVHQDLAAAPLSGMDAPRQVVRIYRVRGLCSQPYGTRRPPFDGGVRQSYQLADRGMRRSQANQRRFDFGNVHVRHDNLPIMSSSHPLESSDTLPSSYFLIPRPSGLTLPPWKRSVFETSCCRCFGRFP
jgi:hypothetical protein